MGGSGFWGFGVGEPDGGGQEAGAISTRVMEELRSHSLGSDLIPVGCSQGRCGEEQEVEGEWLSRCLV